ncbi:MAG: phenylalanine--tRNA ligase subunit beta [Polyangiaceae bacterium]|nr:phenylalanine--tRNA ligase subunit beta [Polyangiaceae bacterium]
MKASYRWLRSLVPQLTAPPEELAQRLTGAGLEVEAIHRYGVGAAACLVAKVVSTRPHPTKSGLKLVTVDRGAAATQELVCGAPNVPEPGGLVVLAPLGAYLPAKNMTIEKRAIAGVESEGMLCSEAELGLSDDGDGILVLPPGTASAGAPFVAAVPEAEDYIFDINLTPNRPDCLGHVGIAREIAALYSYPWAPPTPKVATLSGTTIESLGVGVRIDETSRCPHYGAAAAEGVQVKASPLWLRYRLASLGVRPISNIVDITNLVMLEFGHPMHAFDLDRLERGAPGSALISVRVAKEGETLVTLDGVERTLAADDLVIADGQKAIALAGVMGGKGSEIHDGTTRIVFECAYFEPRTVRRTARRHALHTDASHRFERGVDPSDIEAVLASAAAWTAKLAHAQIAAGTLHVQGNVRFPKTIRLRAPRLRALLGVDVPWTEALDILVRLGNKLVTSTAATAELEPPPHRPDLTREVDLIEEVLRVRGIDNVPEILPAIHPTPDSGGDEVFRERVRAAAVTAGLSEAIVLGMTSPAALAKVKAEAPTVFLKNPLAEHQGAMRTSLLPGLLESVSQARRREQPDARLFAMGPVFIASAEGLPTEPLVLTAVLSGTASFRAYLSKAEPVDVWDAKGAAETLLFALTGQKPTLERGELPPQVHPRGGAWLQVGGKRVGYMGPLHPDVVDAFDLGAHPVMIVSLDLEALRIIGRAAPKFQAIPKFPANARDISLVVKDVVPAGDVQDALKNAAGPLAEDVELFDRFTGGSTPKDHVNLAFRVRYRAADRTLTDAEVDAFHEKARAAVELRFGAQLRT